MTSAELLEILQENDDGSTPALTLEQFTIRNFLLTARITVRLNGYVMRDYSLAQMIWLNAVRGAEPFDIDLGSSTVPVAISPQ
jgi:hypothetical protein